MSTNEMIYDAAVIGSGSGGFTMAIGLTGFGKRVAVIEARDVGGDCTNVGCVPSKTLIHQAATRAYDDPTAPVFATVRGKRDHLRDEETVQLQHVENLDLIFGRARLVGAHEIEVALRDGGTRRISARYIVIATGSRPRSIDVPGLPPERMYTNETIFDLIEAPRHLAIVGSGAVGMEMASAFRDLGSAVSIIERNNRILKQSAPEASAEMKRAYGDRGIAIYHNAAPIAYTASSSTLQISANGVPLELHDVDAVLVAAGRERNIQELGLEAAGVEFDPQTGIAINSFCQTSVPHIYAIGDVTPTSHYTHSANAQGRRVVQRIALPFLPAFGAEPLYPTAIYSRPEVASVGLTPEQIAKRYHAGLVKRIRVDLKKIDRGYTDGVEHGFVQIDAVRLTGRILGATIVGPHAADMLSLLTLAISEGISLYKIYRIVFPYPSYSEAIKRAADTYLRETLPNITGELAAYARYRFARPQPQAEQDGATNPAFSPAR